MAQHFAVVGLPVMGGRVVFSGFAGRETIGFDDYHCQAGQIASRSTDDSAVNCGCSREPRIPSRVIFSTSDRFPAA